MKIAQGNDGKMKVFRVCEFVFATALGGKSNLWYAVKDSVVHPQKRVTLNGASAQKKRHVVAYLKHFMQGCEIPPGKNL